MKCILIKAGEKAEIIELKGKRKLEYNKMKELLGFDSPVTCVSRKIGKKHFDLWLDDEGLLKPSEERVVAAVLDSSTCSEILVGNILIANHDSQGNTTGLEDDEIKTIMSKMTWRGNSDCHMYGYFDSGYCVVKANSQVLEYKL